MDWKDVGNGKENHGTGSGAGLVGADLGIGLPGRYQGNIRSAAVLLSLASGEVHARIFMRFYCRVSGKLRDWMRSPWMGLWIEKSENFELEGAWRGQGKQ